jgi:hypothetical protein
MVEPEVQLKEYADILREMVRHENELTNQRLTWMSTLNGLMLTGLGFIWGKPYDKQVIAVFCTLGIIVCLSGFLSLQIAEDSKFELLRLWKEKEISPDKIPPVFGWVRVNRLILPLLPWKVLPWSLIIAWVILFIVNTVR